MCIPAFHHCNTPEQNHSSEMAPINENGPQTREEEPIGTSIPKPYAEAKAEVLKRRVEFKELLNKANDKQRKNKVLTSAGNYLDSAVCEVLFPYWKGTPWDFNGHTDVPNEGEIACGYLVSTILKHAGVNVNRYKMAQQSALSEIKTISGTTGAKYLGNDSSMALEKIKQLKDGLYILGLSNHVGFIQVAKNEVRFIHSTYLEPTAAINEKAGNSDAFKYSNAYYIGEISGNKPFIQKWLNNKTVTVVLD